jgi:hypothetical protein
LIYIITTCTALSNSSRCSFFGAARAVSANFGDSAFILIQGSAIALIKKRSSQLSAPSLLAKDSTHPAIMTRRAKQLRCKH